MGAWAPGGFENDDAADWVCDLADAADVSVLAEAFSAVNECEGYLEAPDCSIAISAAEVVAALRQHPSPGLPREIRDFVRRIHVGPSDALLAEALQALKRIKTNSELQELWDESNHREAWHRHIAELESRLTQE